MAVDDISKWTPSQKARGISRVSTRFSLSVENERADAIRDSGTCLARPNSQAGAKRDREKHIFPVQLITSEIDNINQLIHTLL